MNSRLAESFVNKTTHTVMGRRLHAYCLYDVLFLLIDENPLYIKHRPVGRADLMAAALIGSTPAAQLLNAPEFSWKTRMRSWLWRRRWAKRPWHLELRKYEMYVADFDARPQFWSSEESGACMKAPWLISVLTFLESHTNATEEQIMMAPLGKMLWKAAALAEQLGMTAAEIMTEDEEAAVEELGLNA